MLVGDVLWPKSVFIMFFFYDFPLIYKVISYRPLEKKKTSQILSLLI